MRGLSQIDYCFMLWMAFIIAFVATSGFVMNYENIMNHEGLTTEQILFTGAEAGGRSVHTTNLWNEGPIGYFGLFLVGVSGCGFVYQSLALLKLLKSNALITSNGGDKVE